LQRSTALTAISSNSINQKLQASTVTVMQTKIAQLNNNVEIKIIGL